MSTHNSAPRFANQSAERRANQQDFEGWRGILRAFAQPASVWVFLQGLASGLPFLLVGPTMTTWMADVKLSLTVIGWLSVAGAYYSLKFIWAPVVDALRIPLLHAWLGRRRSWMLVALCGVILGIVAMAMVGMQAHYSVLLAVISFTAFAGATLDISVDAYRLEIAADEHQAAMAAVSTLGYRIGLMSSGALALYVAQFYSWRSAYLLMAAVLLVPLASLFFAPEPKPEAYALRSDANPPAGGSRSAVWLAGARSFWLPIIEFFRVKGTKSALMLLLFVGCYKFPDQIIGPMAGPFYLASGFDKADIATVSKLFGVWIGIAGAFSGGVAVALYGAPRMLIVGAIGVAFSNLAFLLMAYYPGQIWSFYCAILADNLTQGFSGTVLVAFIATQVDRRYTATQFSLMISLAFLLGKFTSGFSGMLVDRLGFQSFFLLSTLSVVPALLLIAWLWPKLTAERN